MGSPRFHVLFCCLALALCTASAFAYWESEGAPASLADGRQQTPKMVPDGAGGVIIAWDDTRNDNNDIYAQRLDRNGEPLWLPDGNVVCTATGTQAVPWIAGDGAGGAIIVWVDYRSGSDVYAQRLDADGSALWTPDGIPVCIDASTQRAARVVADGFGGAVVVWEDQRNGTNNEDIFAQRLAPDGSRLWGSGGAPVCTEGTEQEDPELVLIPAAVEADARVFVIWLDDRNLGSSDIDLYGQRLTMSGSPEWTVGGMPVCTATGVQGGPQVVVANTGSVVVTWPDERSGSPHIYAQRIDRYGNRAWPSDVNVSGSVVSQGLWPHVAPDGAGGGIIAYTGYVSTYVYPYGQRLDSTGARIWGNGLRLCYPTSEGDGAANVAPDGTGGGVFCFLKWDSSQRDIYARRVTGDGSADIWGENVIMPACTHASDITSEAIEICQADQSSVILCWRDERRGMLNTDVYAQRLLIDSGHWGYPEPELLAVEDVAPDEGGWVRLLVRASGYDMASTPAAEQIAGYNVWRLVEAATTGADRTSPAAAAGSIVSGAAARALGLPDGVWESLGYHAAVQETAYAFVAPTDADSTGAGIPWETYVVTAHAASPTLHFASNTADGYSVDDLAPAAPAGLAGAAGYDPVGLTLSWDPNVEADLAYYTVHRGNDPDFLPSPGNRLGTPTAPGWFDDAWNPAGGHVYKVAAVDRHGNAGPYAVLLPEDLIGVPGNPSPARSALLGVRPNPFNPRSEIVFALAGPGHTKLEVYDVQGRHVRTLCDEILHGGRHIRPWDGCDDRGRAAPSGVYVARLLHRGRIAGTARLVLVR